ncbi:MAG TPA: acetyl-CoA C-acyltransferase [Spirochaetota bacterium]|nr:acetyl-CoA C-acyltransferase [Spirochaetota bacterium]HPC43073.1 acetyl-CoA C-acyltransferase [Spirochaetota bacterium]HPL15290.1 acetyl-CoA C-acyltransferase [Spirochaetota bacterium]HQF06908.1 acetyl-CoA C-acyltransferase [Spirochaetota bacterium]HQH95473.1 acetyl-CoA C-acyltransferase [Spirochaetota bacterium]
MYTKGSRIAVIDGCRTPFQRSGTGYYDIMGWEIGRYAVKGLVSKIPIPAEEIGHVIMGTVAADITTTNVAREIMLGAGLPCTIPAHTNTVACISAGLAIANAANMILCGDADAVIAGGVETFSDPPIKISRAYRRFILDMTMFKRPKTLSGKIKLLRKMKLADFVMPEKPALGEYSTGLIMGQNADRLAKRLGISREDQDAYAAMSHQRAATAMKEGKFRDEMVPVVVSGKDRAIIEDNGPRADATVENLSRLKGAFDRRYGTVTAANSSFLTDGAAAVLVMSEKKAKALGLKPKAYLRSQAITGQDLWEELLLGPAFAIPLAVKKAGIKFSDIGVFEIHEAFAAQMLGVIRCLESDRFGREKLGLPGRAGKVDMNKLNTYGGSLSIGHPFGATGARLLTTCCNRLIESGERFGVIAGCAAGAIGGAVIVENAQY